MAVALFGTDILIDFLTGYKLAIEELFDSRRHHSILKNRLLDGFFLPAPTSRQESWSQDAGRDRELPSMADRGGILNAASLTSYVYV